MAGTGTFGEIIDGDVFKYYAQGHWNKSPSGKSVPIINPSTRKTQFKVQGIATTISKPCLYQLSCWFLTQYLDWRRINNTPI